MHERVGGGKKGQRKSQDIGKHRRERLSRDTPTRWEEKRKKSDREPKSRINNTGYLRGPSTKCGRNSPAIGAVGLWTKSGGEARIKGDFGKLCHAPQTQTGGEGLHQRGKERGGEAK